MEDGSGVRYMHVSGGIDRLEFADCSLELSAKQPVGHGLRCWRYLGGKTGCVMDLGDGSLGVGDVTLMAMIGTFSGWQPGIIIFFLAPVIAVLIVVLQFIVTRDPSTPFGPYLCGAAVIMFVLWDPLWNGWGVELFALGSWILIIMAVCIVIMGAMLWIWRLIKQVLLGI